MKAEGRQTQGKEDKKAELQRATEKEEITSTKPPEYGNTIHKSPLASPRGVNRLNKVN